MGGADGHPGRFAKAKAHASRSGRKLPGAGVDVRVDNGRSRHGQPFAGEIAPSPPVERGRAARGGLGPLRAEGRLLLDDAGPRRAAAWAVLVRTWKPAKPEMTGPAIRPMARPMAIGLAAAHFAAAASRMVAAWLVVPSSSGAGGRQKREHAQDGGAPFS